MLEKIFFSSNIYYEMMYIGILRGFIDKYKYSVCLGKYLMLFSFTIQCLNFARK